LFSTDPDAAVVKMVNEDYLPLVLLTRYALKEVKVTAAGNSCTIPKAWSS